LGNGDRLYTGERRAGTASAGTAGGRLLSMVFYTDLPVTGSSERCTGPEISNDLGGGPLSSL
jgi:hypothetical protein